MKVKKIKKHDCRKGVTMKTKKIIETLDDP